MPNTGLCFDLGDKISWCSIVEFERGKLLQASLLVSEVFVEVEKTVHIVAYELLPVDRLRSNNKLPHQPPRL